MAKKLQINCGTALMFKDERGILDSHEHILLNCGNLLIASTIKIKLLEKNAHINSSSIEVLDITGEITQLAPNSVIDGTVSYAGCFVIALGNLMVQGKGVESLREATGAFVEGALFYPTSSNLSCLAKVRGKLRAYPDDAQVVIGSSDLEKLVVNAARDKKHIWVSDTITALDEAPLVKARRDGLSFTAQSLLTYEGFNDTYGELFTVNEHTLVPDAYEVVESVQEGEFAIYGPKLYVKGDLTLNERDADELREKEAIIVKGNANLPSVACVKAFQRIGKAAAYCIMDGSRREINGFEEFSHALLQSMVQRGEKISLDVDGFLRFTDDVTPEDMECILSLSCNGMVIIPNEARGALESRIKARNGVIGESLESLKSVMENVSAQFPFVKKYMECSIGDETDVTHINTGTFVL
ncbi:MAG: hypothetical protein LBD79_08915 [Treponema sp.]|jgi:hypothetical protein|nr:hypothetical protein [Treponema sp.]